jgi:Lon-like protease
LRHITPGRLLVLGGALAVATLALWVLPSSEYILLPDTAHPVAPLVTVAGGHDPARGGVYFVDVFERKATLLERLFGGLHEGADLYPASEINPPGVDQAQQEKIAVEDMQRSEQIAAAVALKALGRHVVMTPIGVRVEAVAPGMPAVGKLQPDDVIVDVNGRSVKSAVAVFEAMRKIRIGSVVRLTVQRAGTTRSEAIRTVASSTLDPPRRAVVGIEVQTAYDIRLPIKVRIDAGAVGGPSAGLAFALEVMVKLGRNVIHGHKIAATGELWADGSVHPIGGIKQKVIGARRAGVDAFLVPAGDNAQEARKYAHGLRIIAVQNFQQALRALATLPPATG